jgi:hypothetical protein
VRSVANAEASEMNGNRFDSAALGKTIVEGIPVNAMPPTEQAPGSIPSGQHELLLHGSQSMWPAQAAGMVFAAAADA